MSEMLDYIKLWFESGEAVGINLPDIGYKECKVVYLEGDMIIVQPTDGSDSLLLHYSAFSVKIDYKVFKQSKISV